MGHTKSIVNPQALGFGCQSFAKPQGSVIGSRKNYRDCLVA
ncbi:MAG TPA: hypothetical protein PLH34_09790 [Bacillota bacterium]|nr:hypothetical protein [Bacillota bacterium]